MLLATACGSTRPRAVPDVTGKRLDVAEDVLDTSGLHYNTAGGGVFGVIVRSNWYVCEQVPRPKKMAATVELTVARSCSIPDVVGESLGDAEDELSHDGIDVSAHSDDGEEIDVESFWTVCEQSPEEGARTQPVELTVAHDCGEYDW